ncbi:LacI family transcriptional regulator [Actinomycetaceae bacterium TAE3-ERU4]|nr:LacI family transcriptional regulator [Actinomycetaceae bacterium TAE3-ERU4]
MRRATIKDIAAAAGVSASAVSFALNDRPGLGAQTRQRILQTAEEMGWRPNENARALTSDRARSVGLIIGRPAPSMTAEAFYFNFLCGVEKAATRHDCSLRLQIVDSLEQETQLYRRWWNQRAVDGVLLVDICEDDPRPEVLDELQLPYVIVGNAPANIVRSHRLEMRTADSQAMQILLDHLKEEGCESVAYISGYRGMSHTQQRTEAFEQYAKKIGMRARWVDTDYTEGVAKEKTSQLLELPDRPQAFIFDNEALLIGGFDEIRRRGLDVPGEISVISWEDAYVCRALQPTITALSRDSIELGAQATELLMESITNPALQSRTFKTPQLVVRESTLRRAAIIQ